jgi:hypothetical protein
MMQYWNKFLMIVCCFTYLMMAPRVQAQTFSNDTSLTEIETAFDNDTATYTETYAAGIEEEQEKTSVIENEDTILEHRTIANSSWEKIKNDKAFTYKKSTTTVKRTSKSINLGKFFSADMFKVIMFLFVISLAIFIVYFILRDSNFNYFKRSKKDNMSNIQQDIEDIETFTAWEQALQNALAAKDYRLATRILYLEVLQKLSERGIIQYSKNGTNWDYVSQLFQTQYLQNFTQLTHYFDRVWYGYTTINEFQYKMVENAFVNFKKEIE